MRNWMRAWLLLVLLASVRGNANDLWFLPAQEAQLVRLSAAAEEISAVAKPQIGDILYDGAPLVLFRTPQDVSLARLDDTSSAPVVLLHSPDLDPSSLSVSWDGFHAVLSMMLDGHYKLHVLVVDEAEPIPLTTGSGDDRLPALAPDKSFVVFQSNREGHWKLYRLRLRTTPSLEASPLPLTLWETHIDVQVDRPRALLPGPSEDRSASFGPRGLAFLSDVSGTWDLWVLEGADYTSLRRVVANVDVQSPVAWVGERIFIVRAGEPGLISADGRFFQPVDIHEDGWWLSPGAPHFLVEDDILWRVSFSEPPAPEIAFFRDGTEGTDETADLWLTTLDGRSWKVAEQVCLGEAAWSPDGERLAYLRRLRRLAPLPSPEAGYLPDWYELWVADANGTQPRLIHVFTPYEPPWIPAEIQWGPDGDRLYFSVAGSPTHREIWSVRSDGTGLTLLTWGWDFQVHPVRGIAGITRGSMPFIFDPPTGDKRFFDAHGPITQIEFSPSLRLAVGLSGTELMLIDLANETARTLPMSLAKSLWEAPRFAVSWAPDETAFVFAAPLGPDDELFLYELEKARTTQLTNNNTRDVSPAWSPDGRYIAYVSSSGDGPSLWLMEAEEGIPFQAIEEPVRLASILWNPVASRGVR
jgi:Tol biopolymer transport system component